MITREFIQRHRDAILEIARRYGAHDVRIFGSVARGEATETSDLDLIVRFEPDRSLLDRRFRGNRLPAYAMSWFMITLNGIDLPGGRRTDG